MARWGSAHVRIHLLEFVFLILSDLHILVSLLLFGAFNIIFFSFFKICPKPHILFIFLGPLVLNPGPE